MKQAIKSALNLCPPYVLFLGSALCATAYGFTKLAAMLEAYAA